MTFDETKLRAIYEDVDKFALNEPSKFYDDFFFHAGQYVTIHDWFIGENTYLLINSPSKGGSELLMVNRMTGMFWDSESFPAFPRKNAIKRMKRYLNSEPMDLEDDDKKDETLYRHYGNRITLAAECFPEKDSNTEVVTYQFAICSPKDQFSRKIGRTIAKERLRENPKQIQVKAGLRKEQLFLVVLNNMLEKDCETIPEKIKEKLLYVWAAHFITYNLNKRSEK